MGVPDPRPKGLFGYFSLQQSRTVHSQIFNAAGVKTSDTTDNVQTLLLASNREGKSTNRRLPLPGFGATSLWIPPSSYKRYIRAYHPLTPGVHHYFGVTGVPLRSYLNEIYEETVMDMSQAEQSEPALPNWFTAAGVYRPMVDNTRSRLITETLLNLKDQKVNLGETLGTAKQTHNMFGSKTVMLLKGLSTVRHRKWSDLPGILKLTPRQVRGRWGKRVADEYLEFIYGWKPLMQDIHGLSELLKEQVKPPLFIYARRRLGSEYVNTSEWIRHTGMKADLRFDRRYTRKDYCKVTGRVANGFLRPLTQLGLTNPASLAWDLTPWSFVVDWATPIGSVLSAMDAAVGLEFVGGHIGSTFDGTCVVTKRKASDPRPPNSTGWEDVEMSSFIRFDKAMNREKLTSWPTPSVYAKSPFSGSHAITALALLQQLKGLPGLYTKR